MRMHKDNPVFINSQQRTTLAYPFPLRKGSTVNLCGIPIDLTQEECDRVCLFLNALVSPKNKETK